MPHETRADSKARREATNGRDLIAARLCRALMLRP
jgi:hypothetical protein